MGADSPSKKADSRNIEPDSHINKIYDMIVREGEGGKLPENYEGLSREQLSSLEPQLTLQSKISDVSLANLAYDGSGQLSKHGSRQF